MSETRATFPVPSTDRPTCCRMVAVFSTLWDNGTKPRPGVVVRDSDAATNSRVKVFLDETDTEAIRKLLTTSGTADVVVPVTVYDTLTPDQREAIVADVKGNDFIWAEWPARPAPKLGIPVVGSVKDATRSEIAANREPEPAQPGVDPTGQPLDTTAKPDPNAPSPDAPETAPGSPAAPRS